MNVNRILILAVSATMSAEVGAACASRADSAADYRDAPVFELTSCVSAQEYLANNEEFLKAVAEYEYFAEYMERKGMQDSSQAITVKARNSAAVAFMFNAEESTWLYDGNCEEVPLRTAVMLKTRQGCSDTGYLFISFFDDVSILEIYPL